MRTRSHPSARVLGVGALAAGLLLIGAGIATAPLVLANARNNDGNPHVCDNPSNVHGVHDDSGDPGNSGSEGNGNGKDCPITPAPTPTPTAAPTTPTPTPTPTPTATTTTSVSTSSSTVVGVSAASASNPHIAVPLTGADVSFGAGGLLTLAGLLLLGVSARRRRRRDRATLT